MKAVSRARAVAIWSRPSGSRPGSGGGPRAARRCGFDEPVDEQGDADAGDERVDAVVVVKKTGRTCRVCLRSRWRCSTIHWSL